MQDPQVFGVLRRHLSTPSSSFSIGSLGAIAEFHRELDEPLAIDELEVLTIATVRGAISVDLTNDVRPLAYETLSGRAGRWSHGVVFCRPDRVAVSHRRSVLTELGPDRQAVRPADRDVILFDLGLGAPNVDFCIRSDDAALTEALRQALGRSVFEADNPVMPAILSANPHRIAISPLGRVEVYQPIGTTKTPSGPHTHVLPKLLAGGRSHEADIPVPRGFTPCLSLYPASPLVDGEGRIKAFEQPSLDAFNVLFELWGDAECQAEKARALTAIRRGVSPDSYVPPKNRKTKNTLRTLLRQLKHGDGNAQVIEAWCLKFDTGCAPR